MKGQWLGNYFGTNDGQAMIEIDEFKSNFEGVAVLFDNEPTLPPVFAYIRTKDKSARFDLELDLFTFNKITGEVLAWSQAAAHYPGVTFPAKANTQWNFDGANIDVKWSTNIGTNGVANLPQSMANWPSEIVPISMKNWEEFKAYAGKLEPYDFIFRGQENSTWRLRTAFHRTGRANLMRFLQQDVQHLHRSLSNLTSHMFNLSNPIEHAAFVALAQHHGYPTPLLDWTYSPFIAAYFAFNDLKKEQQIDSHKVRIFVFDHKQWRQDYPQQNILTPSPPHFSLLDALALNNSRMVPQQSLASMSNVADIESYIRNCEQRRSKAYLKAIDLPTTSRKEIMQELSLMGITAGSLFPGLDGACRQLKERFFDL